MTTLILECLISAEINGKGRHKEIEALDIALTRAAFRDMDFEACDPCDNCPLCDREGNCCSDYTCVRAS